MNKRSLSISNFECMKRFLINSFLFGTIFLTIVLLLFRLSDKIAERFWGPNTRNQIEMSFKNALSSKASCWFLGNSRIYRINPEMIENEHWYNFAHDNDSYNQMYYKLQYLLDNGCKIDTLVIGTDYFQFSVFSDTRNYIYDDLLGIDYIKDYNTLFLKEKLNNFKKALITKQTAFNQTVIEVAKLLTGEYKSYQVPYLRDNGSYYRDIEEAKENDTTKRDTTILNIQKKYFEQIIKKCKDNGIELFVLMMPVRNNELQNYSNKYITFFNGMINNRLEKYGFKGRYFNMSNNPDFKDYKKYTDITHLNSKAAGEFTKIMYEELFKH